MITERELVLGGIILGVIVIFSLICSALIGGVFGNYMVDKYYPDYYNCKEALGLIKIEEYDDYEDIEEVDENIADGKLKNMLKRILRGIIPAKS